MFLSKRNLADKAVRAPGKSLQNAAMSEDCTAKGLLNLNSEMEMTNNPMNPVIAASHKAVLKHTQSKR